MSHSMKEHIAECYRRAEDYKRLYEKASSLDERDIYLSTRREFLRLAKALEKRPCGCEEAAMGMGLNSPPGNGAATRRSKKQPRPGANRGKYGSRTRLSR